MPPLGVHSPDKTHFGIWVDRAQARLYREAAGRAGFTMLTPWLAETIQAAVDRQSRSRPITRAERRAEMAGQGRPPTRSELATSLGISVRTLSRHIKAGSLAHLQRVSHRSTDRPSPIRTTYSAFISAYLDLNLIADARILAWRRGITLSQWAEQTLTLASEHRELVT